MSSCPLFVTPGYQPKPNLIPAGCSNGPACPAAFWAWSGVCKSLWWWYEIERSITTPTLIDWESSVSFHLHSDWEFYHYPSPLRLREREFYLYPSPLRMRVLSLSISTQIERVISLSISTQIERVLSLSISTLIDREVCHQPHSDREWGLSPSLLW